MANSTKKIVFILCLLIIFNSVLARAGNYGWTRLGPEGGSIGVLVIDPTVPQVVYAITSGWGEVFKSTNGGGRWSFISSLPALVQQP